MTAERNALAHNSVGLETRNTNPGFIRNNIIAYNKTGIDLKSGGQFTGNTITHNETGVHLSGGPGSGLQFYNNCIDSNTDFNITTRSEDTYIQNNYWGTTDSALILHSIKDFYTDFSLGIAHYMPVLQQPDSNCTDVSQYAPTAVPEIPAPTALGIYPNPFSSSFNINAGMQVVRQVTVYSITGAALVTMQPATHNATIDMGGYPAGMYIYKAVLADGSQYAGRLQKE